MRTTFLAALGLALAQAPGGGQINGGVVDDTTTTTTKSGSSSSSKTSSSTSSTVAAAAAAGVSSTATEAAAASSTQDMGPWSDKSYLEGTWQSKSGMVVTGPDFYDPVHELLIDPGLPGISYSFTSDGFWEEAIYQITGDGSNPTCPTAVLIFQHGTYEYFNNGSLVLTPFEEDGRQLLSEPCGDSRDESVYTRYSQVETFKRFEVLIDNYYGRYRLNLYEFDGSPVAPLYLAYKPPQMLPTETMNPTGTSSGSSQSTAASARVKRHLENQRKLRKRGLNTETRYASKAHYDYIWYAGVSLIVGGGLGLAVLS